MTHQKTSSKPLDDAQIIELYWQRDERAITETHVKYQNYLFSIAYHMVHNKQDCEECLNDTYLGAWHAIPPARPQVLKAFLTTIMRRIAIKCYHRNTQKSVVPSELTVSLSEIEEVISDGGDTLSDFDAATLGDIISDFLRSLPSRRRYIFMSRYYMAEPIDTIAKELGVSRSTVNKELATIKLALKEKLESEGYIP